LAPRALDPNGYKLKVAVYYDDSFAEQFKGGAVSRVAALMALVDEMYSEKDSLQTEIEVITVSIEHLEGENWGYVKDWQSYVTPKIWELSGKSKHDANLNVFLTGTGTVAGNLPSVAPLGVVCSPFKWIRYSLTTYPDPEDGLRGRDAYMAEKIAHEIGHNLGIMHDCEGGCCSWWNPRVYKGPRVMDGKECFGYMDYNQTTNYWSHCSVHDLKTYINRVPDFCLEKIIPDPPVEDCLWTIVELITKSKGSQIQWALGTCVSDVDGPRSSPSYMYGPVEEYSDYGKFSQFCCLPGYGDYELRCINTEQQRNSHFAGVYKAYKGTGWHGAYLEIEGKRYCEEFEEGDLRIETVSLPEPQAPAGLENCAQWQTVGNGWCTDESNTEECQWDGGDCCLEDAYTKDYCDECECKETD